MILYLHIGTEKTATTTIQHFLYHNRKALFDRGIALSDYLDKPANRRLAAYCMPEKSFDAYLVNKGITTIDEKKRYFSSFAEEFHQEVESFCHNTEKMFITSEHLYSRLFDIDSIRLLKKLLDEIFSEIKIICYFREQSAVVKSLYSTMIKISYNGSFESLLRDCDPGNPYYNYYDSFTKWRDVFGKEFLTPRIFSRDNLYEGDIRKDILQIIDYPFDPNLYSYSINHKNRSLGLLGLELVRINNRVNKRRNKDGSGNHFRNRIAQIISESEFSQIGDLPFTSAPEIYKAFNESNLKFAKEFLDSYSNPFSPPDNNSSDMYTKIDSSDDPMLRGLFDFFEELLIKIKRLPILDNSYADTLKQIGLRIEKGEQLNLEDAKCLMEIAHLIRPEGPFINKWLKEYKQRLEKEEN